MENKNFNLGLVVGRFEPIHLGHEKIINISLKSCDKTALLVTYNNADSIKNPYSIEYILHLINKIYPEEIQNNKLEVIPFKNDIPFDSKYGEKIISTVNNVCLQRPDFIVYGSDKNISKCFNNDTRKNLFEVVVNRDEFNISATDIREALKNNNIEFVKNNIDCRIYDEIDNMKYYNNKIM